MNHEGLNIQPWKRRGEWVELRFMVRAAEKGLCVTKPWGDSSQYDFAVEYAGQFLRVQVKSTDCKRPTGFVCAVHGSQRRYAENAFDFLAAYVIVEDAWYIIPAEKMRGQASVMLKPNVQQSKFWLYQEAWGLLKGDGCGADTPVRLPPPHRAVTVHLPRTSS